MKENDNLQSRRSFFKNAAKAALPILGAIALANPVVSKAARAASMGCDDGCSYSCKTSCARECRGYCRYSCNTTCSGTCSSRSGR